MIFAEKLDFLMTLTKTTNVSLARFLILDTSYVSRMRTGKRLMPKNDELIRHIAEYFAEHLTDSTNKRIVMDVIKAIPSDSFTNTIASWLMRDDETADEKTSGQVGRFLDNLSGFTPKAPADTGIPAELFTVTDEVISVHYGVVG